MNHRQAVMVVAACGLLTLIGVLLPWVTVSVPTLPASDLGDSEFGRQMQAQLAAAMSKAKTSANGTEGDFKGTFVLILGVVGGAAAAATLARPGTVPLGSRQLLLVALGTFGLACLLTLTDFFRDFSGGSKGIGIFLTLLATLGGAIVSLLALRMTPLTVATPPPAPPPAT
jgi:hypothetical protein